MQKQIEVARLASDQFQEAVTISCEAELARLNTVARDLEVRIAERLEVLKAAEQAAKEPAVGSCNLPPAGRAASASSSASPRRVASGGTLLARGPAPLVAGLRGPLSPPRKASGGIAGSGGSEPTSLSQQHSARGPGQQGLSPPRSTMSAAAQAAASPRRQHAVTTPSAVTPSSRRPIYGRSSGSSQHLGGPVTSSTERQRFAPTGGSVGPVVSHHTMQLRTPPRSKQSPPSTERSERPPLERSAERSSSEGCTARLGGNRGRPPGSSAISISGGTSRRQGSGHASSPGSGSPKPTQGHTGLMRSAAATAVTAVPTQVAGFTSELQRQSSTPRSHTVLQQAGTMPHVTTVAAAANAGIQQAPGLAMSSAARTAVARSTVGSSAAASAASAATAARTASPTSVLQQLQRLETVRCQVQADFWAP